MILVQLQVGDLRAKFEDFSTEMMIAPYLSPFYVLHIW